MVRHVHDEHDAERFAERLRAALGTSCRIGDEEIPVTASIGVVYVAPGDPASPDEVLSRADVRMYRNKRQRRTGTSSGRALRGNCQNGMGDRPDPRVVTGG